MGESHFTHANYSTWPSWYLMTAGHLAWIQLTIPQCNAQSALLQALLWLHMILIFSLGPSPSQDQQLHFCPIIHVKLLCLIPRFYWKISLALNPNSVADPRRLQLNVPSANCQSFQSSDCCAHRDPHTVCLAVTPLGLPFPRSWTFSWKGRTRG